MKNTLKYLAVLLPLVVAVPFLGTAGDRSGTVSEQFLKLPLDARTVAMGGADVALAWGTASIGYNPSGILSVNDYGFGASYTSWFANISNSYAGIVKRIPDVGAFGVSIISLSTDQMIETTPQFPEGTGRTFTVSDFAFSLAFARQVTDQFRVGINGKIIQSYLFDKEYGASTFAFDIGTLYDIPILRSRLGVSLTNIGKDIQFINETYSLPTALRFGVLTDIIKETDQSLVATLQISRLNDADEQYNLGVEYVFNNLVALRGGRKFAYDQENWTFGFGVKLTSLGLNGSVDYAFNNFVYLPGTHSFTIEMDF